MISWLHRLRSRPIRPRRHAVTFDTRTQIWGNSVAWTSVERLRCHGWCEPRPVRGDILKSPMRSGRVGLFVFAHVEYCSDPHDMFFATVEPIGYEEPVS